LRFQFLKPRKDIASAEQVRAVREARGWTVEQMADAVGASPLEVSAWEAGVVAAPPLQAAWVQWMLATDRWYAVTGIPSAPCVWVRAHAPHLYDAMKADLGGVTWYWNSPEVQAHFAGCRTCEGRWRALERLGPQPPEPDEGAFYTLRGRYRRWVQRLPRPFIVLADLPAVAFVAAFALFRPEPGLPSCIAALGLGTLFWIAGLRTVSEMRPGRPLLVRFGAGVLAGAVGWVAGMLYWGFFDPAAQRDNPRLWAVGAVVSVATGLWSSRRNEPAQSTAAHPAQAQPVLAPSAPPHLLPGTRVPGIDEAPSPHAAPVPDRRHLR
jgi:DNA-binding XRE family transcriptional regulator